jgi:RimJ/RimL family protein N-acetyltransferase
MKDAASLRLRGIRSQADLAALIDDLAPGFGDDPSPAREILEQTFVLLTRDARPDPWGCYLAEHEGRTVGTCAFKAAPDASGTVEIAYTTFPAYENRGHATAMAAALIEVAASAGAPVVIAPHPARRERFHARASPQRFRLCR